MNYKIEIDVTSAVQDFYPGLSDSDVDLLAKSISENWDYSSMFNTLSDRIGEYAQFNNIDLYQKDGVYE